MFSVNTIFLRYLIAPSAIDTSGFTTSFSTSSSLVKPRPLQWGQAPSGELNENIAGSNLPIVKSQSGQL